MQEVWTAEFGSQDRFGSGVIIFNNGKLSGGDNAYYYIGDYETSEDKFKAELLITPFMDESESIFNTINEPFKLILTGNFTDNNQHAVAKGHIKGRPQQKIYVRLTKRN